MITLRLNPKIEQDINNTAKNLGITKSELIRKSILEYLSKLDTANAWEVGQDLFGKYSSGLNNLSTERKKIVKKKIRVKRK
ncbi:MAG: CopG family transcriptional regulator [Desulfobacteraceae bacterium]|nr:CopG family transcriptional regulator [Desulfobacteraceae bacterium]MBC2755690.1 CopG family transcriptional regulator [Desulfobacteraceae bacterium]